MMNKILFWFLGVFLFVSGTVYAGNENLEDTVVYGAAKTSDGGENVFVVEQPDGNINPLGNPLPNSNNPPKDFDVDTENNTIDKNKQWQDTPSVPLPLQNENDIEKSVNLGKDFQNTLTEANGRVYDIQSYPEQDFKVMGNPSEPLSIYSPNVND